MYIVVLLFNVYVIRRSYMYNKILVNRCLRTLHIESSPYCFVFVEHLFLIKKENMMRRQDNAKRLYY